MQPCFAVDFNELLEHDLLMRSQTDVRLDINGLLVQLVEGLSVKVQEESSYADGTHELLWAHGLVEANRSGQSGNWNHVKWCCRLDAAGISALTKNGLP